MNTDTERKRVLMHRVSDIRTERLVLREFEPEDWGAVHTYASDPKAVEYMPFGPNQVGETKTFVRERLEEQEAVDRDRYILAVVRAENRRLIGSVGLGLAGTESASLGYILGRPFWGRGYGTEAARAMLDFGFGTLGLRRVTAAPDQRNIASARVLEKIGMRREGAHRESVWIQGAWRDVYAYAILDWEWELARVGPHDACARGPKPSAGS